MELILILVGLWILGLIIDKKQPPMTDSVSTYKTPEAKRKAESSEPYRTTGIPQKWKDARPQAEYMDYNIYINSPLWQDSQARLAVLQYDGYRCRMCDDTTALEVHHISYENLGYESPEELVTLCHACHKETHRVAGKGAKHYPPICRPDSVHSDVKGH